MYGFEALTFNITDGYLGMRCHATVHLMICWKALSHSCLWDCRGHR
jgi:hypothetical protein